MPLGHFAQHGMLSLIEGWLAQAGHALNRVPWVGRTWTLAWLVLPLPIRFHQPFLAGVPWPLIAIPE
jgi:alginate O-acetyltransferase complex protein AlgI